MSTPRPLQISNSDLTEGKLPPPNAGWRVLYKFASSFDGWDYMAKAEPSTKLATFANAILRAFHQDEVISTDLTMSELRACLFYEASRFRHLGRGYNEARFMPHVHALVEAIRERIVAARIEDQ